jgi:hypothetical protein
MGPGPAFASTLGSCDQPLGESRVSALYYAARFLRRAATVRARREPANATIAAAVMARTGANGVWPLWCAALSAKASFGFDGW